MTSSPAAPAAVPAVGDLPATARLLLLVEGDETTARAALTAVGERDDTVVVTVTDATADAVSDALPTLLEALPALEVAVLGGALASETWRRHPAFQLHLTLVDAPTPDALDSALQGAVAMLG